jgi:hypothetical protein
MAYRVTMEELGVVNDQAAFEGQTPGDVWRRVKEHLKDKHNIKLPALEDLGGETVLFPVVPRLDGAAATGQQAPAIAAAGASDTDGSDEARLIATRLLEKLHAGEQGSGSSDIVPPGGTQSPMP